MQKENKYYFVPYPLDYKIARIMVDTEVRIKPITGDEAVIKLHKGAVKKYKQLKKYKHYNAKQARKKIQKEWDYTKEE